MKCECGSEIAGSPVHSYWCPKSGVTVGEVTIKPEEINIAYQGVVEVCLHGFDLIIRNRSAVNVYFNGCPKTGIRVAPGNTYHRGVTTDEYENLTICAEYGTVHVHTTEIE